MEIDMYSVCTDDPIEDKFIFAKQVTNGFDEYAFHQFQQYGFSREDVRRLGENGRLKMRPYRKFYGIPFIELNNARTFILDDEPLFSIHMEQCTDYINLKILANFKVEYHIRPEDWVKGEHE